VPVAEQPQHLTALAAANERRLTRARERRELRGAPVKRVVEALITPGPHLASYTLEELLAPAKGMGAIRQFNNGSLRAALAECAHSTPHGRADWHADLKLAELTVAERRRLARAVVKQAPKCWSEAAS